MTDQQILEKAIQKAIDGGYFVPSGQKVVSLQDQWITYTSDHHKDYSEQVANLIFSHKFAKALWGEKSITDTMTYGQHLWSANEDLSFEGSRWQYHLQQMVIAEDPIKYLGDNI